jgi:SAM-dependent methyltransferase
MLRNLIETVGAQNVTVVGNSAGGGLSLAAAQWLREAGHPQPNALILICPGVNGTLNQCTQADAARDVMQDVPCMVEAFRMYAGDLDVTHPFVSPLNGNFEGLAPMLILTGTHDLYHPDIVTLANKAARAGVSVKMQVRNGLQHNYPLLPTPEGHEARGIFARAVVGFAIRVDRDVALAVNYPELRLAGLDIAPEMIRVATERLGVRAEIKLGDAEWLPWEDASFDYVFCVDSFHHYPNPKRALSEFHRVLKPNRQVVLADRTAPLPVRGVLNSIVRLLPIFSERFAALLGSPPAAYVARWRMHLAGTWLRAKRLTVSEVATRLGNESEASFSRAFKRFMGASPSTFRRRHTGTHVEAVGTKTRAPNVAHAPGASRRRYP